MLRDTSIFETGHKSWKTKPFWKPLALTILLVIILAAGTNALVDPFGLYGTGIFPQFSFNRYTNLRQLFINSQPRPEALIIGSSRVGCMDPEVVTELTGYECFNWGVPAAESEILLSILKTALYEFDAPLKMVIVGVEPEIFHPTKRIHPQALVSSDYTKHFSDESEWAAGLESARRLITFEQLWASAVVVKRKITKRETGDWMVWRDDGYPTGIIEERLPARYVANPEEHLAHQIKIFPETFFILSEFDSLGTQRKAYWEEFLKICADNDIDVYAFMPPPHPGILGRLMDLGAGPVFDETESYLERTVSGGGGGGGVFMNFTDVESFDGDPDGFQDQVHIHPDNGDLMIRKLLGQFERTD